MGARGKALLTAAAEAISFAAVCAPVKDGLDDLRIVLRKAIVGNYNTCP